MSNRKIIVEHEGIEYTGELGTIKSTSLGIEDHGIFSAYLTVEWPGSGISVGGYSLDTSNGKPYPDHKREGTAFGLDQIMHILDTVGVYSWEKLPGKQIIVLFEGGGGWGSTSVGIASATDDKVLIFKDHAQEWLNREGEDR